MPSNIMTKNSTDNILLKNRDWFNLSILTNDHNKMEKSIGEYYSMIAKQSINEPRIEESSSLQIKEQLMPSTPKDGKKPSLRLIKAASLKLRRGHSVQRTHINNNNNSSIEEQEISSETERTLAKKKSLTRVNQILNDHHRESIILKSDYRNSTEENIPLHNNNTNSTSSNNVFYDYFLNNELRMYQIIRTIGSGNFSKVKLASHIENKKFYAIKIIDKTKLNESAQRLLSREISILYKLNHPNIIQLFEVVHTLSKTNLIMEYLCGGNLYDRINHYGLFSNYENQVIFAQIVDALNYLHGKNFVHRDIKGDNIIFVNKLPDEGKSRIPSRDNARGKSFKTNLTKKFNPTSETQQSYTFYKVKLADFGFSKEADSSSSLTTFCGSPAYAAPELFHSKCYDGRKVDIWALGVTLHFLVSGKLPFIGTNVNQLKGMIMKFEKFQERFDISKDLNLLIGKLLVKNPKDRLPITTQKFIEKLNPDSVPSWTDYLDRASVSKKFIPKLTKSPSCILSQAIEKSIPNEEKTTIRSLMKIRGFSRKKLNIL